MALFYGRRRMSLYPQKDTEEAAVALESNYSWIKTSDAKQSLYAAYLQNECETSAQLLTNKAFLKNPLKALVEEKYGIEYGKIYQSLACCNLALSPFVLKSSLPCFSITVLSDYRIPATVPLPFPSRLTIIPVLN